MPKPQMTEDADAGVTCVLPGNDQLFLTDVATRCHRFHPSPARKEDVQYAQNFRVECKRKYTTLCRAWRIYLDPDGVGRIPFLTFSAKARFMGFREPKRLWMVLNTKRTNFLTLDEWDPVAFRNLYEFRGICLAQYGKMDAAFNFGMDRTGSRTVTLPELERFCDDHDFTGDVKALLEAVDMHHHGYITLDELDFLAKWEGEKYGKMERLFEFELNRLNVRKQKTAWQKAKMAAKLPGMSTADSRSKVPNEQDEFTLVELPISHKI
jgi:hypothetical protein